MQLIGFLFRFGPLWFGIGFLAPVLSAMILALHITPPLGLAPISSGLIIGAALGLIATFRRTWL